MHNQHTATRLLLHESQPAVLQRVTAFYSLDQEDSKIMHVSITFLLTQNGQTHDEQRRVSVTARCSSSITVTQWSTLKGAQSIPDEDSTQSSRTIFSPFRNQLKRLSAPVIPFSHSFRNSLYLTCALFYIC